MDDPPDYNSAQATAVAKKLQQVWSTTQRPTELPSAQSRPSIVESDDEPFRVALVMFQVSHAYVDSRGVVQPSRLLKVKYGTIIISRNTTEAEFTQRQEECIDKTYKFHAWKCAPRTDAGLASRTKCATAKQLRSEISRLVNEKDKGMDPVYRFTFSSKKGKRVKTETESQLSFTMKRMFDFVFRR
jgi:hypothetical protein